ncbi:unnamed protein product [Echinostoma caproni]|uniref:SEC7 domain-containing protein n=1 Tax=Echinostoma caproni TaxID=27848 RepID=A0A183BB05_9TREM|nr:unnamed protein product [Echinostoma caproni]
MDNRLSGHITTDPPPPLLSALNPAPGRFKPRARLLTIRPRRSPRLCARSMEEHSEKFVNAQPLKATDTLTLPKYQPCPRTDTNVVVPSQTPCSNKYPQPIQKFMKRISVRFSQAPKTDSQTSEPPKRTPSRFSFNTWRRRKSLSQIENKIERDRSPMKAERMALDEQWALYQSTDLSVEENCSVESLQIDPEEKENDPHRRGREIQMWMNKRRSLWNFSFSSTSSSSTSSVNAAPGQTLRSSVSSACSPCVMDTDTVPRSESDTDISRPRPLATPHPRKRKCTTYARQSILSHHRKRGSTISQQSNTIEKANSSCSVDAGDNPQPLRSRAGSITPTSLSSSVPVQERGPLSPVQKDTRGRRLTFLASSPSAQTSPDVWQSGDDRLSHCSLDLTLTQSGWSSGDKPHGHDSGLSSEVSTSSGRLVESTDLTGEPDPNEANTATGKDGSSALTLQDVPAGSSPSSAHMRRYTVRPGSLIKSNDINWNNCLRRSLDRAGRQCRLLVGRTLFNKNPVEGMQYMLDHGLLPRVPEAIARYLFKETELSRQAIGEYFGTLTDSLASLVLREYLQLMNMHNLEVDEALRVVLSHFHPVGESQKISHLMQTFQETYTAQNLERVAERFRSPETIEILAYSVILLHTDLHNPNVRRVGKRMSKAEFVSNNRGIDADQDLPLEMLQAIYDRIAETQFKTLPDPYDRLRSLDTFLTGSLKTDNFLQRHRRFVGWVSGHQLDCIVTRRSPKRPHGRARHFFVFNDILVVAKPVTAGSLLNLAAAAATVDNTVSTTTTGSTVNGGSSGSMANMNSSNQQLNSSVTSIAAAVTATNIRRKSLPTDSIVEHRLRPHTSVDSAGKLTCSTELVTSGTYHVRLVLPLADLRVLVFESQYYHFGVQLCGDTGPILNMSLASAESRQMFIDWLHTSIAEMAELRNYYKAKTEQRASAPVGSEPGSSGATDIETRL